MVGRAYNKPILVPSHWPRPVDGHDRNCSSLPWNALTANVSEPVLKSYAITEADVAGPFDKRILHGLEQAAKLRGRLSLGRHADRACALRARSRGATATDRPQRLPNAAQGCPAIERPEMHLRSKPVADEPQPGDASMSRFRHGVVRHRPYCPHPGGAARCCGSGPSEIDGTEFTWSTNSPLSVAQAHPRNRREQAVVCSRRSRQSRRR
jgi:hypothetical protein